MGQNNVILTVLSKGKNTNYFLFIKFFIHLICLVDKEQVCKIRKVESKSLPQPLRHNSFIYTLFRVINRIITFRMPLHHPFVTPLLIPLLFLRNLYAIPSSSLRWGNAALRLVIIYCQECATYLLRICKVFTKFQYLQNTYQILRKYLPNTYQLLLIVVRQESSYWRKFWGILG